MKKLIPLFTLLFSAALVSGQITVTDASFPATGDTLKIRTNFIPDGIELGDAGGDKVWDFTSLGGNLTNEFIYLDASAGSVASEVPLATHVVIDATTGAENYYRVTSESVSFIASNGEDPVGAGINALFRFEPPIIERRAPLTFPATYESESNLSIAFAWDDLPAFITDSIPSPIVPDSIRIRVNQVQDDFVDAWGTLSIPGGEHEVLREKRTLERDTRLEVLVEIPIIGLQWQDVTDLFGGGTGLFAGLGQDTITAYNFYGNDAKEVIATARVNNETGEIERVDYKDYGIVSSTNEAELVEVNISPNPASEFINLELGDFLEGEFDLKIFALTGNLLLEKTMQSARGQIEQINISDLPAGSHIFQITEPSGKLRATGKIVKI